MNPLSIILFVYLFIGCFLLTRVTFEIEETENKFVLFIVCLVLVVILPVMVIVLYLKDRK